MTDRLTIRRHLLEALFTRLSDHPPGPEDLQGVPTSEMDAVAAELEAEGLIVRGISREVLTDEHNNRRQAMQPVSLTKAGGAEVLAIRAERA